MTLDKLPSILTETEFTNNGLVNEGGTLLVPAYVASQFGFNRPGREYLKKFYERLRVEASVFALCPFQACREYLNLSDLEDITTIEAEKSFWNNFDSIVGPVNYENLMPKSLLMIALLDGSHAVNDGVCAEIGWYAGVYKNEKPIVSIRSDFRLSENPYAPINVAVRYCLDIGPFNNWAFFGPNAYEEAISSISSLAKQIISQRAGTTTLQPDAQ